MFLRRFAIRLFVAAILVLFLPLVSYSSSVKNNIRDIRFSSNGRFTRIVVECDGKIDYKQNLLKFPDRLYFDLHYTAPASFSNKSLAVNDSAVKAIRISRYNHSTTRIVLRLLSYDDYNVYTLEKPDRLVIDINYGNRNEKFVPRKRIIVVDAGHGGRDPGA
ncbi:MAG TPA: N-acetylmuramoyl-L-alanine amidase, partial [Nitrospirae bacterium]|nr:N-acetylmuramoyl-L-alanine amidase [Nitrospirota bacterium]